MDFNAMLYRIDSNLTQEDLESFKFLCVDLLPSKRLVSIKSNLDFFEELQKSSLIDENNHFLLAELLYIIGQHSLLRLLNSSRHRVQEDLREKGLIPLYRRMLFELYENITKDDLNEIIFLLQPPKKFKENKSFLDILCYLEKKEVISENNLDVLENAIRRVAPDLVGTVITKYKKDLQRMMQTSMPSEEDFEDLPKPQFPVQVVAAALSSPGMKIPTDDMGTLSIAEHIEEVCGLGNDEGDLKAGNTEKQQNVLSLNDQVYAMNRKHRGYCLIISNKEFMKRNPRLGTERDEESLRKVFTWLELDVELHKDLTAQEIQERLSDFQARDHTQRDCFVCCILSHGQSRAVLGTDNGVTHIERIVSYFSPTNCKTLAGKPKLFFIQACQGENLQRAHDIEADATASSDEKKTDLSIPNDADVLVGMSTVDGYSSFRHTEKGSWYIQALCENLTKMVPKGEDILSILTKVNKDVSEMEYSDPGRAKMKQMPQPAYTLRKKLVFPAPITPYKSASQETY